MRPNQSRRLITSVMALVLLVAVVVAAKSIHSPRPPKVGSVKTYDSIVAPFGPNFDRDLNIQALQHAATRVHNVLWPYKAERDLANLEIAFQIAEEDVHVGAAPNHTLITASDKFRADLR